jgi:hypothetical protein
MILLQIEQVFEKFGSSKVLYQLSNLERYRGNFGKDFMTCLQFEFPLKDSSADQNPRKKQSKRS